MKELGSGKYQPSVFAHFPRLGRGHTTRGICPACKTGGASGHTDQKANREDWEESVGLIRTKSATKAASTQTRKARLAANDPKSLTSLAPAVIPE